MSICRQILYHLVFRTKDSRKTLVQKHSRELYAYLLGFIRNKNCFLYRINGIEDHLFYFALSIFRGLTPTVIKMKLFQSFWFGLFILRWLSQEFIYPKHLTWIIHKFFKRVFFYPPLTPPCPQGGGGWLTFNGLQGFFCNYNVPELNNKCTNNIVYAPHPSLRAGRGRGG